MRYNENTEADIMPDNNSVSLIDPDGNATVEAMTHSAALALSPLIEVTDALGIELQIEVAVVNKQKTPGGVPEGTPKPEFNGVAKARGYGAFGTELKTIIAKAKYGSKSKKVVGQLGQQVELEAFLGVGTPIIQSTLFAKATMNLETGDMSYEGGTRVKINTKCNNV